MTAPTAQPSRFSSASIARTPGICTYCTGSIGCAQQPAPKDTPLPELVSIPAGCFVMGSPENEPGRNDHERAHRVCVAAFANDAW